MPAFFKAKWPFILASGFAIILAVLHISKYIEIDSIGFALLFAIWVPWLLQIVQTIEFGGAKLTLRELQDKVDILLDASAETDETDELTSKETRDYLDLEAQQAQVLQAIVHPRYSLRTLSGIAKTAGMASRPMVESILETLVAKNVVRRVIGRKGSALWGLTDLGRSYLGANITE